MHESRNKAGNNYRRINSHRQERRTRWEKVLCYNIMYVEMLDFLSGPLYPSIETEDTPQYV